MLSGQKLQLIKYQFSAPQFVFSHIILTTLKHCSTYMEAITIRGAVETFRQDKTTILLAGRHATTATVALHYTESMVLPVLSNATSLTMYSACIKQLVVESSECPTEVDSLFLERGVAKPNTPRCMAF